jgi:hypothetical protein
MNDEDKRDATPATPAAEQPASSSSSPAEGRQARVAAAPTPEAEAEQLDAQLAELVKAAMRVDWSRVELDPPPAFVEVVGAELVEAPIVIKCDCGQLVRLYLDGESIAKCPRCQARYRHLLVVQGEAWAADGCPRAIAAILEANL